MAHKIEMTLEQKPKDIKGRSQRAGNGNSGENGNNGNSRTVKDAKLRVIYEGDDQRKWHYLLLTPSGQEIILQKNDAMVLSLASEVTESVIDVTQALGPVEIGVKVIDLLRQRGIKFEGNILEAYDLLGEVHDRWLVLEQKRTEGYKQSLTQSTLKNLSQKIGVTGWGWLRLNPAERESIATFYQSITVAALKGFVDDDAVAASKRVKQIHNNLRTRLGWLASLGLNLGEVLGPARDGISQTLGDAKSAIIDATHQIPTAAGKGLGGLAGGFWG